MTDETTGSLIASGWYADPLRSGGLRWWSGSGWTEHVRDAVPASPIPQPAPSATSAPPASPIPPASQPAYPATQPVYPAVHPGFAPQPFSTRPTSNSIAWWSLGLGILSLVLTVSVLIHNTATIIVSTSGVLAIINGVRAINHRKQGRATARVAPILGIVFGSTATLIMVVSFATAFLPFPVSGQGVGALPQPAPSAVDPLGRQPATPLPDTVLNSYSRVTVAATSARAAGCTLAGVPLPLPSSTVVKTAERQEQDLMSWDIQPVAQALQAAKTASGAWPTIEVDPADGRVFTDTCKPIGFIPVGTTLEYAVSPDKADAALLIADEPMKLAVIWRSTDDTIYLQ
jgi:hypothetical protein